MSARWRIQVASLAVLAAGLLSAPALIAGSPPDGASEVEVTRAQELYEEGAREFRAGAFEHAAALFAQSYDVVASPNSKMMRATSLEQLGNVGEAYEAMAAAAREAAELAKRVPRYVGTAEQAESERRKLADRVAILDLRVVGASAETVTVFVGPRQVSRASWGEVAVVPGSWDVVARVPGGRRIWKLVEARAGASEIVELDVARATSEGPGPDPIATPEAVPAPADEPTPATPERESDAKRLDLMPFAYVAAGVGVAGFATFVIAGSMSQSTFADLEQDCPRTDCPAGSEDTISAGKTEQTVANVGLVLGVLGAGAGVTLFVLSRGQTESVALRAGAGSVAVRGAF